MALKKCHLEGWHSPPDTIPRRNWPAAGRRRCCAPPRTPHGKTYVIARRTASDRGQIFPTPKNPSLPRGGLGGGLSWLSLVAGWCMLTRVTAGGTPLHGVGGRSAQTHTHDATIESCRGGSGHTPSNGEGAVARTDPVGLHWGGRRRGASVFPRPLVRIAPSCVSVRLVGTRCFPRESGGLVTAGSLPWSRRPSTVRGTRRFAVGLPAGSSAGFPSVWSRPLPDDW